MQEQADFINKIPESSKKTKDYILWIEETVSKTPDEWRNTEEYARLLEELKSRKE